MPLKCGIIIFNRQNSLYSQQTVTVKRLTNSIERSITLILATNQFTVNQAKLVKPSTKFENNL